MIRRLPSLSLVALALFLASCDTAPIDRDALVVEAYFQPGQPLPMVHVSRTQDLRAPHSGGAVVGAAVEVLVDDELYRYGDARTPGDYAPPRAVNLEAGQRFSLSVRDGSDVATARGEIPPLLVMDSVRVSVPDAPIRAVLLDSLALPLDSLAVSDTGFIYAIDVTLWWRAPAGLGDYWVETSVQPVESFSSRLIDFFLPSSSVLEEPHADHGQRSWTGLYAVPVSSAQEPVPPHRIRAGVVRGDLDYARYALSRRDPDRREPIGNVSGGVGIVAGIALDSVSVYIQ